MARRPLLFALALVAGSATAQMRPRAPEPWTFGIRAGVGMGYRTLSANLATLENELIIAIRDEREVPKLAVGTVVNMGKQLGKRIGVEMGLGYHQLGWVHRVDLEDLTYGDIIDPRRGYIYATDNAIPSKSTFKDSFHYIEMPIGLTVRVGKGRLRSVSAVGMAPSIMVAARGRTIYEYGDGTKEETRYQKSEDFKGFNWFAYLSTGLALRTSDRFEWRLQPTVRYGLVDILDAPITASLYSGTVDVGFRYVL